MIRTDPLFIGPTLPQLFLGRWPYESLLPMLIASSVPAFIIGQTFLVVVFLVPLATIVQYLAKDKPLIFTHFYLWLMTKAKLNKHRVDGVMYISSLPSRPY